MRRIVWGVLVALMGSVGLGRADGPRLKFTKGETLTYKLVQTTKTVETLLDEKTKMPAAQEHTTKATVVRQWQVTEVDAQGVATLAMSIVSMRWEQTLPNGEKDEFDSTKPDELNKGEMAKHVGPVLAVLRVDPQGKVVEVKESKVGAPTRFQVDLPFKLTLPDAAPKVGETWQRQYTIQLDPPQGTGEKYAATQTYTVAEPTSGLMTVTLATTVKDQPTEAAEQIPLLPLLSEGTCYFDPTAGRYYAARLKMHKELKNHHGEGTSYKYTTTYVEDLVPAK